jgi:hypothetical protein
VNVVRSAALSENVERSHPTIRAVRAVRVPVTYVVDTSATSRRLTAALWTPIARADRAIRM